MNHRIETLLLLLLAFGASLADSAPINLPRLEGIEVDGQKNEWQERGYEIPFLMPLKGSRPPKKDHSATARLGWDERGLLLFLEVADDASDEETDHQLYLGDSVELFLADRVGSGNWFQVVAAPGTAKETGSVRLSIKESREGREESAEVEVASARTPVGYDLEVRLPWSKLGVEPKLATECALQIIANDRDEGSERTQLPWFPGLSTFSDSTQMIAIALAEKPDAPVPGVVRMERIGSSVIVRFEGDETAPEQDLEILAPDDRRLARSLVVRGRAGIVLPREAADEGLTVRLGERELKRFDPLREMVPAGKLKEARFGLTPTVFAGDAFPKPSLRDREEHEALLGPLTVDWEFYDADHRRVSAPSGAGRYGVVFRVAAANGEKVTRTQTLFRLPEKVDWNVGKFEFGEIKLPNWLAPNAAVAHEQRHAIADVFRGVLRDDFEADPRSAILLAGLHEMEATGATAVDRTDFQRRDADWWYAQRQGTGDLEPYDRLIHLPKDYDADPARRWPLVVFLHGSGNGGSLEKLKKWGPPKQVAAGREFPFILAAPRSPPGQWMWWFAPQVGAFIDEIETKYRIDQDRIYVTGLSMGGYGAWYLAQEYPDRFAAIAPFCGGGDPADAARIKDVPVWAFHGEDDRAVPVERTREMIEALEKVGGKPKVTYYPETGHQCWEEAYSGTELYEWLLGQRRTTSKEDPE